LKNARASRFLRLEIVLLPFLLLAFPAPGRAVAAVRPGGLAAGGDGSLWFPEMGTGHVANLTAEGVLIDYAIPGAAALGEAIAAGPDGRIWVVGFGLDGKVHVWALSRSGVAADVATLSDRPLVLSFLPSSLASGPDRNVWIANLAEIDRVSPNGQIARFPIADGAIASSIAAGPDGNLWFVAALGAFGSGGQGVWRVAATGAMTRVLDETSSGISTPTSIIAASDGRLWFADNGYSELVAVSTSPVARTNVAFTGASRLASGPDGNIWITVPGRRAIARFSPFGSSTEFVLPTPLSIPVGIAAGLDGNLWFSEPDNGVVGRITQEGQVREFDLGALVRLPIRSSRSTRLVSNH